MYKCGENDLCLQQHISLYIGYDFWQVYAREDVVDANKIYEFIKLAFVLRLFYVQTANIHNTEHNVHSVWLHLTHK